MSLILLTTDARDFLYFMTLLAAKRVQKGEKVMHVASRRMASGRRSGSQSGLLFFFDSCGPVSDLATLNKTD